MTRPPRVPLRTQASWYRTRVRRRVGRGLVAVCKPAAWRRPVRPGVTLLTVTFNSQHQFEVQQDALARYTTQPVERLVIDNGSKDGTRQLLRQSPDIRSVFLPFNLGHGPAADLGMLLARTTEVVMLDVDAFPIDAGWLDAVLEPLARGAFVAGGHVRRDYIHPSFVAMRRTDFLSHRLSFIAVGRAPTPKDPVTGLFLDVGENLSHNLTLAHGSEAVHKIEPTSVRGPGLIGTVFGGLVYHNFYSTHGKGELARESRAAWEAAIARYCPPAGPGSVTAR